MGVTDIGEIALWSGLSLGVTPAVTALMSPLWGRLADRVGRKIMIERSLASFIVVMAAMAFVTKAWHVFALRALQGLFAGYGALALTMAADAAPRDRMAFAIGTVQTAQRIGPALGPVIGGTVAQIVGLRNAFLVTAGFYVVALILVFTMYHERRARTPSATPPEQRITFRNVLALENFVLLIAVVFGLQFVDRSFGPVLPLYVAELGTPVDRIPILSGILFSISAGAGAVGNHLARGLLARATAKTVIARSAAVSAVGHGDLRVRRRDGRSDDWDCHLRSGHRRRQHRGVHRRWGGHPVRGARRGIRIAVDGLAHRSGDEPDHLRTARHAQPPRGLCARHRRAAVRGRLVRRLMAMAPTTTTPAPATEEV